ncbi:hypothetical protein ES708_04154 [subsurface metagenome]
MTPITPNGGYVEPGQIGRLINACSNPRDRAFIALLARTGMRIGEALQLKGPEGI